MTDRDTVALLGTGTMGAGVARNLAAAGFDLRAWNRTPGKARALEEVGARASATPADAVDGRDVLITMLWDAEVVATVMDDAAPALRPGTLWIQSSTVGVAGAARLAGIAERHDLQYVDAPVLGSRKPAEDGTLVILASGPDAVRDRCTPIFEAIGSRTVWVGEAGLGSKLKLVANAWVLTVIEGIAECFTLAGSLGLDPALFLEAVRGGAMDAPYVGLKGTAMLTGDYTPTFTLSGAAKDAGLIMEAARSTGAQVGVLERACEHLDNAVAAGHGDLDMAATYLAHQRP